MRLPTLVVVTLMLLLALSTALPALAEPEADHPDPAPPIDHTATFLGADTWMFSIHATEDYNVSGASFFEVTGHYPAADARQDIGALFGVVQGTSDASCPDGDGFDPCFMLMSGSSIKDLTDVTVDSVDAPQIKVDDDVAQWGQVTWRIGWSEQAVFTVPEGQDEVTYRYFVTLPGVDRLDVRVHFHSQQSISIHDEIAYEGGFLRTGEDFQPNLLVDTAVSTTLLYGETTVTQDQFGDYLYGSIGMGSNGALLVPNPLTGNRCLSCPTEYMSVAAGSYGVQVPNGNTQSAFAAGIADGGAPLFQGEGPPPASLISLVGNRQIGDFDFFVNEWTSVGVQDLYVVGFKGPVAA